MNQLLLAWSILLTILTAVNLMLCLGIVRRLKTQEHAKQEQLPDLLAPGTAVGEFATHTLDGDIIATETLSRPTLVAFVMPGCEPCATVVAELRQHARPDRAVLVVMDDGPDGQSLSYGENLRDLGEVVVAPPGSPVMQAFGDITAYPSLFRVDSRTVIASGRRMAALASTPQPVSA